MLCRLANLHVQWDKLCERYDSNLKSRVFTLQYEYTPFEFGSWTGRAKAFAALQYLGTNLTGGQPIASDRCVEGYDTALFVCGTCLSALNFC